MNPVEINPGRPGAGEVRAALEKVAASEGFSSAGRLPQFLRHLVEAALAGQTERLKESALGVEFFGRDASFDPRIDSVVRVEARRLRARLEEYYQGEGRADAVKISLPKGAYVPEFAYAAGAPEAARPADGPRLTPMPRGWKLAGILVLLATAGILLGWWQSRSMRRLREAPVATIAVLPWENPDGDPENESVGDGLTEGILQRLARTPGIRVVDRSLTSAYRGKPPTLDEAALRLNASMIVEGSVRRQGQRLRVTARLTGVRNGATLWAGSYESTAAGLSAIEDQIARSIATALHIQTGATGRDAPDVRQPSRQDRSRH